MANGDEIADVPGVARRDARARSYAHRRRWSTSTGCPARLARNCRRSSPTVFGRSFHHSRLSVPVHVLWDRSHVGDSWPQQLPAKSVDSVVDEITYLVSDFDINFVSITDDLFVSKHPGSQQRAVEFASAILRRGIDVNFMVDIRLDSVVDLDVFRHLHQAGLRRVFVGIETGSYEQLRAYRKQIINRGQDPPKPSTPYCGWGSM
ncbi:putative methyltransferase/methylase [Mycobacterium kansasii]|uniref:Putative methyltransferase/methylase n=1 Tax=Mycobacterium kansasii TaxID=1768 RepID=A0A1V3X308_MYCKA|nr:putative methyltransferase/methylase [Mycobacterium kansasii]